MHFSGLVNHSDIVEAVSTGIDIFILDVTPDFNGTGKGNWKTRWESFKFCVLVWLIL